MQPAHPDEVFIEEDGKIIGVTMTIARYNALMERLEYLEDSIAAIEALNNTDPATTLTLEQLTNELTKE